MKNCLLNTMKFLTALVLLAFAVGCVTVQREHLLSEAGFRIITASSPKQQERLKTLPPGKVTSVKKSSGKTYFVFPDPARNQLYVGDQAQYKKYRQLRLQQKLRDEEIGAELDEELDEYLAED